MKNILNLLVTLIMPVFISSCSGNSSDIGTKKESMTPVNDTISYNVQRVVIPVEGMTCASCAARIKKGIKEIKGVQEVEVSLERREAKVKFSTKETSPEIIAKAIDDLGYKTKKPIIQK